MNLDGANVKSVTTSAVKMQEWTPQMFTKIDRDRTSIFRSATMRASYMSINRVDVQQAVKEVARFMAEPDEGAWIMLKRSGSIPCGSRQAGAGDLGTEVRQGTPPRDLACADESGRCEREVSDDSSGEYARVDAADVHED